MKAAAYVRNSSDKQEASPERQRDEVRTYAEKRGYEIVEWYEDLGVSGNKTELRTEFQRMIADGASGKFRAIVCFDQDRFGRFDLIEAGKWIYPLQQAGVFLDSVTGGKTDWTNVVDQLGFMAKQLGKHQYLESLARNVRSGHDKSFRAGKWRNGFAPFGYAVDPATKKLIPGPSEEVRVLREIFTRYAAGDFPRLIADWINALGIPTRRGNRWQRRSVDHVIQNLHYRGHTIQNEQDRSDYLDSKQWQLVKNTHEPLIDQDLWDRVQARRETNQHMTGPNTKNQYPFTGIIYCASCGGRMGGGKDAGRPRYVCLTYVSGKGCDRRTVNEAELLEVVLREIRSQFFDPLMNKQNREKVRKAIVKSLTEGDGELSRKRDQDRRRLAEIDGELNQAVSAMIATSEDLRPLVEKRVRLLQDERDRLADAVSQQTEPAGEQIKRFDARISAALAWIDKLEAMAATKYDPNALRKLLGAFVDRIEVETERTPNASGKRHTVKLVGGRIYFQAGQLAQFANLVSPSGRIVRLTVTADNRLCLAFAA